MMYLEGLCMCMCVFCACATIPSEIQSCDVPLIYTIPPNTPTEYLYWFLFSFYKIKNSAPPDIKETALIFFYYVELQWTKKMHFLFYSLLGQSHIPFARTLNGAWKYRLLVRMFLSAFNWTPRLMGNKEATTRWVTQISCHSFFLAVFIGCFSAAQWEADCLWTHMMHKLIWYFVIQPTEEAHWHVIGWIVCLSSRSLAHQRVSEGRITEIHTGSGYRTRS